MAPRNYCTGIELKTPELANELNTEPSHIGVPIWPKKALPPNMELLNSVLAQLYCFGAILYELLIGGLMDPVFQSDAYHWEASWYRQSNGIPYYSKDTIVIYSNDFRRNAGAVHVICGKKCRKQIYCNHIILARAMFPELEVIYYAQ